MSVFGPIVRVALARCIFGLRYYGDDERVSLAAAETAGEALVVIGFAAFYAEALSLTCEEI